MFYRAYLYRLLNGGERRSAQVEFMNYRRSDDNSLLLGYRYTYDEQGNISAVYKSNATGTDTNPTWTYTYDNQLGQLTASKDYTPGTSIPTSYAYTYDTAGNIRSAKKTTMKMGYITTGKFVLRGPVTDSVTEKSFSYDNASWPDLLTSVTVDGTTKNIEYQTSESGNLTGNPITYYNGADYTFEWGKGTQLTSATVGDAEISYTYDMSGVRSSKTVGGTTHTYTTLSGLVMQQTDGTQELYFLYDDSNQPYALIYKSSATETPSFYYYLLNVQGDVVGLLNASGTIVAEYQYDPWGVPTVKTASGAQGNDAAIGNVNPLRYRGYYYDTETGFYYLQSRYYDPAIGRFISADSFATTDCNGFLSANMFAYCENNPVIGVDYNGEVFETIFDVVSLGFSAAEVAANPADPWAWANLAGDIVDLIPFVTGVGETIRTVKTAKKAASKVDKVIEAAKTVNHVHGNSLKTTKEAIGYALVHKNTGVIMKYGETTRGVKRYTRKFYRTNNVKMVILNRGSKYDMHCWQHNQILNYYKYNGRRPPMNKSFW